MKCIYSDEMDGKDEYFTINLIRLEHSCFESIGKLLNF
mgnify:FL=1